MTAVSHASQAYLTASKEGTIISKSLHIVLFNLPKSNKIINDGFDTVKRGV